MGGQIIDFHEWLQKPAGQYMLAWERGEFDEAVADLFGFHAVQLGLDEIDALKGNRMPHRWLAAGEAPAAPNSNAHSNVNRRAVAFVSEFSALPFAANSLDLVILPHTLELGADPHACLREVERVLVPEGRVIISGLNPVSLWGFRQRRAHWYSRAGFGETYLPQQGEFIGYWRLRDWLRLLSFEVETSRFGCYRPSVKSQGWLDRFAWMDRLGRRWWPIFGAVYFVVAVKRVRGVRLLGVPWKAVTSRATAPVSVANQSHRQSGDDV
jgi:SAM-dependent methyltransferase